MNFELVNLYFQELQKRKEFQETWLYSSRSQLFQNLAFVVYSCTANSFETVHQIFPSVKNELRTTYFLLTPVPQGQARKGRNLQDGEKEMRSECRAFPCWIQCAVDAAQSCAGYRGVQPPAAQESHASGEWGDCYLIPLPAARSSTGMERRPR